MAAISDGRSPRKVLIGVDIGATSIKVGAFSEHGRELIVVHRPNAPAPQRDFPGGIIWNLARMRRQAFDALREVVSHLDGAEPVGIGVTAFGADGAPMSSSGKQLYPAISWHEQRAKPQCARIIEELTPATIYSITGYHLAPMATVCKWAWLRENRPDVLEGATWLMIPDQMVYWLTGEMLTDPMSASCEVAIDLRTGGWAEDMIRSGRDRSEPARTVRPPGPCRGSGSAGDRGCPRAPA